MSNCTPCTPANDELPIFCDPFPATDTAKRLLVEDEAFCQKALNIPTTPNQILKTNASGNIQWGTINSVLQSGPVDLGSQPLTTTGAVNSGAITATSVTTTGAITAASVTTTGAVNAGSIEVGNINDAFIDFKSPASEDYDMRVGTLDGLNGHVTTKAGQNLKIYAPSADVHIQSDAGNRVGIGTTAPTEKLEVIGNIKASASLMSQNIEVGSTSGTPFIDIKNPTVDDYDLRLTTDGTNGIIQSFGNIYIQPALSKSIIINNISTYANNAAAVAGGLAVNSVYKTATGELRIVV